MLEKSSYIRLQSFIIEDIIQAIARADAQFADVLASIRSRQPAAEGLTHRSERRGGQYLPVMVAEAPPEHRHHAVIRVSDDCDFCVTAPHLSSQFAPNAQRAHMRCPFAVLIGAAAGADDASLGNLHIAVVLTHVSAGRQAQRL